MKKLFPILLLVFFIIGCGNMGTTPTGIVEDFFAKYQKTDKKVITQLNDVVNDDVTLTITQKDAYKNAIKRQYKALTYDIKNEVINGNDAIVTAEIEVYDLYKTTQTSQQYLTDNPTEFVDTNNLYSEGKFLDYRIGKMSSEISKIKYTLSLSLTKKDNKWVLDDLTETDREKIHGLYNYS